jgi:hypothetical protein
MKSLLVVITAVCALTLLIVAPNTSAQPPQISTVTFSGSADNYTVTITGTGFGSPVVALPYAGDVSNFRIGDSAQLGHGEWGYSGDANPLTYKSWSNNQIVVSRFGGEPGDAVVIALWNSSSQAAASWGGNVTPVPSGYPSISAVRFSNSGQNLTMTITGTGFGPSPADLSSGFLNLRFEDWQTHCNGGSSKFNAGFDGLGVEPSTVGLVYSYWSNNEIVISGFGSGYGGGCYVVSPNDAVSIEIWNSEDQDPAEPQTAWGGPATPIGPVTGVMNSVQFSTIQASAGFSIQQNFYISAPNDPICGGGVLQQSDLPYWVQNVLGFMKLPAVGWVGLHEYEVWTWPALQLIACNGPIHNNQCQLLEQLALQPSLITAPELLRFSATNALTLTSSITGGELSFQSSDGTRHAPTLTSGIIPNLSSRCIVAALSDEQVEANGQSNVQSNNKQPQLDIVGLQNGGGVDLQNSVGSVTSKLLSQGGWISPGTTVLIEQAQVTNPSPSAPPDYPCSSTQEFSSGLQWGFANESTADFAPTNPTSAEGVIFVPALGVATSDSDLGICGPGIFSAAP